ncbi:hypothetical protein [Cohnella kolymensis]|uniref:hypothetical protein n=1 Tax=Cohnella kolymensis TaxID=1590652 RepID=UPI000695E037|nr:hypothetical protein [Cohnella kolymensis]
MNDNGFGLRIRQLVSLTGSTVKVVVEERFPGGRLVGGKYNPATHTITLFRDCIREQCIQLFGTENVLDQYAAIILAHELGHAQDPQLAQLAEQLASPVASKREQRKIALKIEKNAWNFACALFPEWKQSALCQEIAYQSLADYYKAMAPDFAEARSTQKQPASA